MKMSFQNVNRNLIWHFLFFVYSVFLSDFVLRLSQSVLIDGERNTIFGVFIFVLIFLEPFFFVPKMRAILSRADDERAGRVMSMVSVLGIGKIIFTILVMLMGADALGLMDDFPGWLGFVIIVLVIRDVVVLALIGKGKEVKKFSIWEWICDFFLFVNVCILFTIIWDGVFMAEKMWEGVTWQLVPLMVFAGVLLLSLIYIPLRITNIAEDYAVAENKAERRNVWRWIFLSMLMVVLGGVIS